LNLSAQESQELKFILNTVLEGIDKIELVDMELLYHHIDKILIQIDNGDGSVLLLHDILAMQVFIQVFGEKFNSSQEVKDLQKSIYSFLDQLEGAKG